MLLKTELTFVEAVKESRTGRMQELKRLGRYLVKNKSCVLTYARQTSDETLQVHVDSDWLEICLEEKHDRCDREKRQTFVATHVMFAGRLSHYRAEKLSITLWFEERVRAWEFNHITKTG